MWIDSHAHLTMFEPDEVPAVLARAAHSGVTGVLVPATGADDLDGVVGLAAAYPDRIVAAVGVHPHDASTLDDGLKSRLRLAVSSPGMVAVGEIGLDYHYMNSPREDQLAALRWQLELARETGLPVVVHNRDSWSDLEGVLAELRGQVRGVCHSFTEGPAEAGRVVELGFAVGISGMVTFKGAHGIREMAAALDRQTTLVETDSPFLAPVPHRGKRNEPALARLVGERLAEVWQLAAPEVASSTTAVFRDLFRLPPTWPPGGPGSAS